MVAFELGFATPLGMLLALAVALPAGALLLARARAARAREALGMEDPGRRAFVFAVAAAALVAALLGLAAGQPVVQRTGVQTARTDAEVYVVLDTSRSMLAKRGRGEPSRIERAKRAAQAMRDAMPTVPVGIASLTDRVLPHLFPSANEDVFRTTLERSIGVENPPPRSGFLTNVTRVDAIASMPQFNFFREDAAKRVVVVFTDGESVPFNAAGVARRLAGPPRVATVFVHTWDIRERVFTRGVPEAQYKPDRQARPMLDRLAIATEGKVFGDGEAGEVAGRVREELGSGPTVELGERRFRFALAPWLALGALLPAGFLLWRRDR